MRDWAPIAASVGFGTLFVILLAFCLRLVFQVKSALSKLEKRLSNIEARLSAQDTAIKEIRTLVEQEKSDPIMGLVNTALDWKKRGAGVTAGLLGAQVFRSYWKSRKPGALPGRKEKSHEPQRR